MIGLTDFSPRFQRREFLRLGAVGAGLSLPQLLSAAPAKSARARSVILFFLLGGQSQLDTFDMKPNAPENIRGEFSSIATATTGLRICEHLPLLAARTRDFAILRSMTHKVSNHNPGTYYALSGVPLAREVVAVTRGPDDFPHPGAILSKFLPTHAGLPPFVQLSPPVVGDALTQVPGQDAGFLGAKYNPFKVTADPGQEQFNVEELSLPERVTLPRFERRRNLLQTVQNEFPLIGELAELQKMDTFHHQACELVTSPAARRAFDLNLEAKKLRDRYGRHTWGQSLLLARRLVEAGVRLVSVFWGGLLNGPDDYWDTHKANFPKQKNHLLPKFDQCLSALLDDLNDRGLLDSTLVLCMGEFGRTPRIGSVTANADTDSTGRDHWPQCYHAILAGGGVTGGAVVGKSDQYAAWPVERPASPEDLTATLYHALGMDTSAEIRDRLGRPLPVTRGKPVLELFA